MAKRKYNRKTYQSKKKTNFVFRILKSIGLLLLLCFLFSISLFFYYAKDLPVPEKFTERFPVQSTKIYDNSGEILLYEIYGEERRTIIPLSSMSEHLKKAVVATEDINFYSHFGIDPVGIVRSVLVNLSVMKPIAGGSTIPQQLIRSTFLSPQKTIERKIKEIILSLELDRRHSKDQILEWYLNQVPFGSNAYGAEAASQIYFNKPCKEISIAEASILASLIQAPSRLSPYGENIDKLLIRKDYVIDRMTENNLISFEQGKEAKEEIIEFSQRQTKIKAPYFTLIVKQKLEEKYGTEFLRRKGLKVYTTLDWEFQKEVEEIVKAGIETNKAYNAHNAGLVSIEVGTGKVIALTVGDGDYYASSFPNDCIPGKNCLFEPRFNVVTGTKKNPGRQPGSSFKPFVYVTAFEKGYDDTKEVLDEETNFGIWGDEEYIPQNYDGKFNGLITLRNALAQSVNVASVKTLLDLAGLEDSVKTTKKMGISTLEPPYGPSIVLGGWEVKLIEMTSAYGVFASNGFKTSPTFISKIVDNEGNILEETRINPKRILSKQSTSKINSILSDNEARAPIFGRNSALYFRDYQVAAKTGTTQNYRDAWTIGYSSSVVTGAWVGNNNNAEMAEKPGVVLAGPIFHKVMERALLRYPSISLP